MTKTIRGVRTYGEPESLGSPTIRTRDAAPAGRQSKEVHVHIHNGERPRAATPVLGRRTRVAAGTIKTLVASFPGPNYRAEAEQNRLNVYLLSDSLDPGDVRDGLDAGEMAENERGIDPNYTGPPTGADPEEMYRDMGGPPAKTRDRGKMTLAEQNADTTATLEAMNAANRAFYGGCK